MTARHVETLFCDDIRHEVNGKLSYIGVYAGTLLASAFPATLPKFCVSITILTPADEPLQALTLRLLKDEETFREIVLDADQLASASTVFAELNNEGHQQQRIQKIQALLAFTPLHLEKACTLRVCALADHSELWGIGLKIDQIPSPSKRLN